MGLENAYIKQKDTLFAIDTPEYNKLVLEDFLEKVDEDVKSFNSKINYVNTLISFSRVINIDYRNLSVDDIKKYKLHLKKYTYISKSKQKKGYSESTKRTHSVIIRKFVKFLISPQIGKKQSPAPKLRKEIGNADLKELLPAKPVKNDKLPDDMIEKQQIKNMIGVAKYPRDKALISVLWESGARLGEILSSNIEDVKFDEHGCLLTFQESKTMKRRVRLIYSTTLIQNWIIDHHPQKGNLKAPLWCLIQRPYTRCSRSLFSKIVKNVAEEAGIDITQKKVNPHNWRHTRATELCVKLPDPVLKKYMGWKDNSRQPATYIHLNDEAVDNEVLKIWGIVKDDTTKDQLVVNECPRCKYKFNPDTGDKAGNFCKICGMPLNDETFKQYEAAKADARYNVSKLLREDAEFAEEFEKEYRKNT
jgi:integrase/recombinase XerD